MASVWDSVVGQDRAVDQLRHAVINPVHAFLLVGVEGCGCDMVEGTWRCDVGPSSTHTRGPPDEDNRGERADHRFLDHVVRRGEAGGHQVRALSL